MNDIFCEYLNDISNHKFDYVYLRNLKNLDLSEDAVLLMVKLVCQSEEEVDIKELQYSPAEFCGLLVGDKKTIQYIRIAEFDKDGKLTQINNITLDDKGNLYVDEKCVCVHNGDDYDVITHFDKTGDIIEIDFDRGH